MQEVVPWVTQKSRRRPHTSGQLRAREHYTHGDLIWVRVLDGHTSTETPQLTDSVLIPSVAVLRAALPLLEDRSFPLPHCVFLQSVLRVLGDMITGKEYKTLCKCLANGFVNAHVLLNEQARSTWRLQQPYEPAEEHLMQLIRSAYSAIAQSLPNVTVKICVLDKEHDPLAALKDLPLCTVKEVLEGLRPEVDSDTVHRFEALAAQLIMKCKPTASKGALSSEFPGYLPDREIMEGLKSGKLFEGTLHVLPHNPREAEVHVEQGTQTTVYLVQGRHRMNRALNGDKVCIQVLPPEEWAESESSRSLTFVVETADENIDIDTADASDAATATTSESKASSSAHVQPTCKVVGCTYRQYKQYVCTILRDSLTKEEGRDEFVLAIPLDKTVPKLRIRTKQGHELAGQRIVVQFDDWPEDSMYPNGHFITVIGEAGDWNVEVATLLQEKGLVFPPFSTAALACLPAVPVPPVEDQPNQPWVDSMWTPSEVEVTSRKDLRDCRIFSIDPPGCQDIDDAMSVRWLDDLTLEVGVHIADVTHFVEQGSPLDRAAQQRATTVYLVHKRFDMLPRLLSSDVCSLHQNKDRHAFSVLWRMHVFDQNDQKVTRSDPVTLDRLLKFVPQEEGVWVGKTLIRSCAAMTYNQADRLIHELPPDAEGTTFPPLGQAGQRIPVEQWEGLRADVKLLTLIARHFRSLRMGSGALELTGGGSELKFRLDADGVPVEVSSKSDEEIHHTIAELMILANSTVASTVRAVFPLDALLRKHPPPQSQKVQQLNELTNVLGISFDDRDAHAMQEALERLNKPSPDQPDAALATQSLVTSLLIRAMNEAQYVCTGAALKSAQQATTIATDDATTSTSLGHYGLGLSNYTHFTSPIRRYADVIAHRQLATVIHFLRTEHLQGNTSFAVYDVHKLGIGFNPNKLPRWDPMKEDQGLKAEVPPVIVPDSSTISVEAMWKGEPQHAPAPSNTEFEMTADEDFLDDLLGDVVDLGSTTSGTPALAPIANYAAALAGQEVALPEESEPDADPTQAQDASDSAEIDPPYSTTTLARICVHLNEMNRRAKAASMDCQKLFLALYFKNHVADEPAVVYEVKDNGFLVYVPKYDLKGAVYLKSRSGTFHARPQLFGLPALEGSPPEQEFELLNDCRALPRLTTSFTQEDRSGTKTDVLRVMDGATVLASFRPMDVVTVRISGRQAGSVQRAPTLKLHLLQVGRTVERSPTSQSSKTVTAAMLEAIASEETSEAAAKRRHKEIASSFLPYAQGWAVLPRKAQGEHDAMREARGVLVDTNILPRTQCLDLVWRDASSSTDAPSDSQANIYTCVIDLASSFGLNGSLFGCIGVDRITQATELQVDVRVQQKMLRRRQKLRDQTPRKLVGKARIVRRIRFQGYQPPRSQFGLYTGEEQKSDSQEGSAAEVLQQQPGWSQEYPELEELPGFGIGTALQVDNTSSQNNSQQDLNRQVQLATQRTQRLRAEKRHYSKPKG